MSAQGRSRSGRGIAERLVTRLASRRPAGSDGPSRRGFLAGATIAGAALAVEPWGYLTRPVDAYSSLCGTDASCSAGYSAFCCTINNGHNTCPPNTYPGGWWKADRSSFCGGAARYYIDCNAKPGYHFSCHCADNGTCDHRLVACNVFRYGQCNTQVAGVTAVVCRQISCRPPWELYPGHCGKSSATDQNTAGHTAPCLTKANTYPALKIFPAAPSTLASGHALTADHRLTSPDRHTSVKMHSNGNLAVWNENGAVWQSHTFVAGSYAILAANGNLMVRRPDHTTVWQTGAAPYGTNWYLQVRDSGAFVVTNGKLAHWSSYTHTP
jgi:hypothetical protein